MSDVNKAAFFNQERQQKVMKWVNEKWKENKCECCGSNQWILVDKLIVPPIYDNGIQLGGPIMPFVVIGCATCGNAKFLSAMITGIMDGVG